MAGLTGCDSKASQERQQKLEAIVQTYSEDVSEVRTSKENAGEFYDHWSRTELAGYTVASILSGDNDQIISDAKVKAGDIYDHWSKTELAGYTAAIVTADGNMEKVKTAKAIAGVTYDCWSKDELSMYTVASVIALNNNSE